MEMNLPSSNLHYMKKFFFAALVLCLAFGACQKSGEDDNDQPPTKTEILTSGSWRISGYEVDTLGDGTFEIDVYSLVFEDCDKDDFLVFKTSGDLDFDEGPSKCEDNDPQVYTLSWRLLDSDTKLEIEGDPYDIMELSNSTLKLVYMDQGAYGERITMSKR
jgi:hypothetical protein